MLKLQKIHFFLIIFHKNNNRTYQKQYQTPLLKSIENPFLLLPGSFQKGHLCIMGDIPASILQVGTVQDVKDYCKKLIDECGKDGGFILSNMPMDYARPENVKAMVDFTRKYGVYN